MEAMAIESLVATLWELDGFLTRVRWPVQVPNGWSDVDVVGIDSQGRLRLCESKVPWGPRYVFALTGDHPLEALLSRHGGEAALTNVERLWEQQPGWLPARTQLKSVEFWLCTNVWFDSPETRRVADRELTTLFRESVGTTLRRTKISCHVVSTLDVVLDAVVATRREIMESGMGQRFGHPVLDTFREILRYLRPRPYGGGRVAERIAAESRDRIFETFDLHAE
jgi:hypothetical protein